LTSFLPNYDLGLSTFRWEFGGEKVYVVVILNEETVAKERLYKT